MAREEALPSADGPHAEKNAALPPAQPGRDGSVKMFMKRISWLLLTCLCALSIERHFDARHTPDFFNNTFRPAAVDHYQEAIRLLSNHPLIDGHNDLAIHIRAAYKNHLSDDFYTRLEHGNLSGHIDIPRMKEGKYGGAFWSAFYICPTDIFDFSNEAYEPVVRATMEQLDIYQRLQTRYPMYFTPARTAREATRHFSHHRRLISPLAIEGLHQIGNSASLLRLYHALGVRYATLTWNCHNRYADAAMLSFLHNGTTVAAPPLHRGVSAAGRALVREMNRIGMLVDLSHTSEATMRDVLAGEHDGVPLAWAGSRAPPIFSHSSAHALCPHPRNVPDAVLRLVRRRGGLVMVTFSPDFVSCTPGSRSGTGGLPDFFPANATLAQVATHIMHIGNLIGFEHVGIGSDFDGIETTPRGLEDVARMPNLVAELLRRGVTREDAVKVAGGNLLRVWAEADRVSAEMQREGVPELEDELTHLVP